MDRWGRLAKEKKKKRPGRDEVDWGDYMNHKKSKLNAQFNFGKKSEGNESTHLLFHGLSFYVNGLTDPPETELREIIIKHGGIYSPYLSGRINYVIATNLADSKKKKLGGRTLKPSFITESVLKGKLEKARLHLLYPPEPSNLKMIRQISPKPSTSSTSIKSSSISQSVNSLPVSQIISSKAPKCSEISPGSPTFSKFRSSKFAISTPLPPSQIRRISSSRRLFFQDSDDSLPEVDEPSLHFMEDSQTQLFKFDSNSPPLEFYTQESNVENFLPSLPSEQIGSKFSENSRKIVQNSLDQSSKALGSNRKRIDNWDIANKFHILNTKKIQIVSNKNKEDKECEIKEFDKVEHIVNEKLKIESFSECSTLYSEESSEEELVKFPSSDESSTGEISEDEDLFSTQIPIKSREKKRKPRRFTTLCQSPTPPFLISKWDHLNPINQLRNEYLDKAAEEQKNDNLIPVVSDWFTGCDDHLTKGQLLEARDFLMPKFRPALNGKHEMEDVRNEIRRVIQIEHNPDDGDLNVFLTYFTELMKTGFTANSEILLRFLKRRIEDETVNENWKNVFYRVINEVQDYAIKNRHGMFRFNF